jgi:4-hydroxy-4-methyl-2-oxoglutarate aldolase
MSNDVGRRSGQDHDNDAARTPTKLNELRQQYADQIELGRVHRLVQTISDEMLERFEELEFPSSPVSDALDKLGVNGAVAASLLRPTIAGVRIVGRARTLKQMPVSGTASANAALDRNPRWLTMAVHLEARRGDVIVVESPGGASSSGAAAIPFGQELGEVGAVVDGAIRDVGLSRRFGFPIWAREVTPVSGKWRIEHAEINGIVTICGVRVSPGDLVVADDDGVCFVPADLSEAVLELCLGKRRREKETYGI